MTNVQKKRFKYRYNNPVVVLLIDDIIDTTDRECRVILQANQRIVKLPLSECQFYPNRVIIPAWLAARYPNDIAPECLR